MHLRAIAWQVAAAAAFGLAAAPCRAAGPDLTAKGKITFGTGEKVAIRVNCGGQFGDPHWLYTDGDGLLWVGDQQYTPARQWGFVGGEGLFREEDWITVVKDTRAPGVYRAEHFGMNKYTFGVPAGKYTVRLHFAEGYFALYEPGARVFSVQINGKPMLDHFDILKEAGEFAKAVVKEFPAVEATDRIDIGFVKETQSPVIDGIEILGQSVLTQPFDFVLGNLPGKGPAMLPDPGKALYRINCGMALGKDYRYGLDGDVVWMQDQMFETGKDDGAMDGDGSLRSIAAVDTPVSRAVYCAERYRPKAYRFKVPDGTYDVRFHFVETYAPNNAPGKRVFDLTVNGKPVATNVDPFVRGGGIGNPVVVEASGQRIAGGWLTVGFEAKTTQQEPIVNGIEVFRIEP